MNKNTLKRLYQAPKTILTTKDLALIWDEIDLDKLKSKISYYVKQGTLIHLARGIFTKDKDYNPKELATSIYTPSYISFETVLREAGIIFQHFETFFVAGPWSRARKISKYVFIFRQMKDSVLFNSSGIINEDNISIATPERAFLDMIYLFPKYYFDNLEPINWQKCFKLAKIYNNKKLIKRLNKYYKNYAK